MSRYASAPARNGREVSWERAGLRHQSPYDDAVCEDPVGVPAMGHADSDVAAACERGDEDERDTRCQELAMSSHHGKIGPSSDMGR